VSPEVDVLPAFASVLNADPDRQRLVRPLLQLAMRRDDLAEVGENVTQQIVPPDAQARHVNMRAVVVKPNHSTIIKRVTVMSASGR
jgi:hypothetical protein